MKLIKLSSLIIVVFLTLSGCSSDNGNAPDTNDSLDASLYYEELNISYGDDDNQVFDLYLPANRTSETKVMVLVHGGAWIGGDKADMDDFKNYIQTDSPNMAIVNMNYRLADADNLPIPMQTDDISSVIETLKTNKDYYVISDDFGFLGVSAGGHLSMLWSYTRDTNNDVKMVASIVGPTNLADPEYTENPVYDPLFNIFGDNLTDNYLQEVSPFHRATASSPPTILFYGGMDPLVPTSQGVDMDAKLTALNVTHEFTLYPNEGHGWVGLNLLDTATKLKLFTETHLGN